MTLQISRLRWVSATMLTLFSLFTIVNTVQAEQVYTDNIALETYGLPSLYFHQTNTGGHPDFTWQATGTGITSGLSGALYTGPDMLATVGLIINPKGLGVNNYNAQTPLHVTKLSAYTGELVTRFRVSDDGVGRLNIDNVSSAAGVFVPRIQGKSASANAALIFEGQVDVDTGVGPVIVHNAAKISGGGVVTRPLVVYRNNNVAKVTISATGAVMATSFHPVSSRELKHSIVSLDSDLAARALKELDPVRFVYKDDPATTHIGFIAEDVPDLVANSDRQSVPIMDVVALMTRVVQDNQDRIKRQSEALEQYRQEIAIRQTSIERNRREAAQQAEKLAEQQKAAEEQQLLIETITKQLESLEQKSQDRKKE